MVTQEIGKRLLLIDANSLIHRAFHALPPLATSTGEMVNAVYGFCLAFFKAIKEFQPDYIAAAFDVAGPTFRDTKFKAYKAKREKAPDELYNQMPLVKKVLAAFHVPVYEKEGFEADDIIGTISLQAPKKQVRPPLETIILSGDADVFQLVDKNTKAYTLRKGIQDSVLYDEKAVEKRFGGLRPAQLIDYKALRGDPSDNIPGVTGIGEKTAIALLLQFGSLDTLYKEIEGNTEKAKSLKPRVRDMLVQYKDQAAISKELARIERHTPITFKLSSLAWKDFDEKETEQLFQSFGFRSLVLRLPELHGGTKKQEQEKDQGADDQAATIAQLERDGVLSKDIAYVERHLTPVLRAMEKRGIAIDKEYFASLEKEIKKELGRAESKIFTLANSVFNISSPKQLSHVLFEKLMLSPKGMHKTPGGIVSTASPELEKIQSLHPIAQEVLRFRELSKLLNTYVAPLPLLVDKEGRIHTHFQQFGAETGRLSSVRPNLQNIPLQGEWGKKVRRGFVAAPGNQLVSFDYSQMELRVAAHIAQEPKMRTIFQNNEDVHKMTAAEVFGVAAQDVTDEMRYRAKALNFGVLYGMGARGFAESAKISMEEAQQFIDDYFMRFPQIAEYVEKTKEFVKEKGYTETLFGRRRYLPDINSFTPPIRAAAERAAVNFPIQGCLPWDTRILTSKGYIPIGKLYSMKEGQPSFVWDGTEWKSYLVRNRGKAQLAQITFSNGQVFKCDVRHKVLAVDENGYEWKHFSALKPGVRVCFSMPVVHEFESKPVSFSYTPKVHNGIPLSITAGPKLWYWLGYYLGDGHLQKRWSSRVWRYDLEYFFGDHEKGKVLKCKAFFSSLGLNPRESVNTHVPYKKASKRYRVSITSQGLGLLFESLGFHSGKNAHTKRLPGRIFEESYENRVALIRGIMESDGSMGDKTKNTPSIHLCQRELLQDIQLLLKTLGTESKIRGPYRYKQRTSYYLDIHRNMLGQILKNTELSLHDRSMNNLVPQFLLQEITAQSMAKAQFSTESDAVLYSRWKHGGSSSLYHFRNWLLRNSMTLRQPLYMSYEITDVQTLKAQEITYTLSVPGSHRFDSEGVISKNTAADIMKMAMVKIFQEYESNTCRMLLQIHDELLFEVADDIVKESTVKIQRAMEEVAKLVVPLVVQVKAGFNWGEMRKIETETT